MVDLKPHVRTLSTPEAAQYCSSSASTFEKLRLNGGGPAYCKLGRRVTYLVSDLDDWLTANRRRSTSEVETPRPARARATV
jgi:predicted DNA-binding transcriptional regulator AlpA